MQDKVTETLAVNTGNMIASLNLQVAKSQVENHALKCTIKELQTENDRYKIENEELRKKVKANESNSNYANH